MVVKVKRLKNVPLPSYQTKGASGLDLYAAIDKPVFIPAGGVYLIPTGIAVEIPKGYEGQIRPRSGLATAGIWTIFGTIDSDYRGELKVLLFNGCCRMVNWPEDEREGVTIEPLMRIAQLVISPVQRVELVEVEELTSTGRGNKGFGSTGLK